MNSGPQSVLQQARTLLLDMDGTLLDLAFDNYVWKELIPRRYALENDLPFADAHALLMSRYEAVQGDLEWYCLDHWCDRLGIDVVQLHYDVSHRIAYLPGALRFLKALRERDIEVLLVTNAHPDTLALKDAITGLGDYFDGLYSSHQYGHAKESQHFWNAFREDVGFDTDSSLFVDDSQPVLASAERFGIGMLVTVTRPDTTLPAVTRSEYMGVESVADLLD